MARLSRRGTDMYPAPADGPAVPLPLQGDNHVGGVLLDLPPVRERGLNLSQTCVELRRHGSNQRTQAVGAAVQNGTAVAISVIRRISRLR